MNKIVEQNQKLPSFLSAGNPRDRRGRIARKSFLHHDAENPYTPAQRENLILERTREKQLLETLRSPNLQDIKGNDRSGFGIDPEQEDELWDAGGEEEVDDIATSIKNDFGQNDFGLLGLRAAEAAQDGRSVRRRGSQS